MKMLYKIFNKLSIKRKFDLFKLIILLVIGLSIDLFGLGMFIPIIGILLDENAIDNYKENYNILNDLQVADNNFLIFISLLLLGIYFLRSVILIIITYYQSTFISNYLHEVLIKTFQHYVKSSYEFFLKNNTSNLLKNLNTEIHNIFNVINSGLSIIVEGMFILFIIIFLLVYNFNVTITLSAYLLAVSAIYYLFVKIKMTKLGQEREVLDTNINNLIFDAFEGIREVKFYNLEQYFNNELSKSSNIKSKINSKQLTINQTPRLFFEFNAVLLFTVAIIFFNNYGYSNSEIALRIGVYGVILVRMLPSISKILASIQTLIFYLPSLDIIFQIINSKDKSSISMQNISSDTKRILFKDIKYSYNSKKVIDINSFEIDRGKIIGIYGKSGEGKTTLLNIISGLLKNNTMSIYFNSKKASNINFNEISFLSQNTFLMKDSILNNIVLNDVNFDRKKLDIANKVSGVDKIVRETSDGINHQVDEKGKNLSFGQIQKIGIARAVYKNSQVYFFDEPTSALDTNSENNFLNNLNQIKKDKFILIISHKMSTLKFCDKIYELKNNKLNEK
tara:strand:- start:4654 stop:6342 length:1689 start_codon:yes stop_codon:yes gene_type:complete